MVSIVCLVTGAKKTAAEGSLRVFSLPGKSRWQRKRLCRSLGSFDGCVFADPSFGAFLPAQEMSSSEAFFRRELIPMCRLLPGRKVLFGGDLPLASAMLSAFPDLALSGRDALAVSVGLYRSEGAAVPIVSGVGDGDVAVFGEGLTEERARTLFTFAPRPPYAGIARALGRGLSYDEAARLFSRDKNASFYILSKLS